MRTGTSIKVKGIHLRDISARGCTSVMTCIPCSFSVVMMAIIILCLLLNLYHINMNETQTSALMQVDAIKCALQSHGLRNSVEIMPLNMRLLFAMPSNSFDQFLSLQKVLDSLRDICNAGWNVTVAIQSSSGFDALHPMYEVLSDRLYCIRSQSVIPIIFQVTIDMEHDLIRQ